LELKPSNLQGTPQNCGGALLKFAQHNKIIKQDNSSSFLEKKNQKRSDVNAVQKTAFDDAEKQIYTAKEQQSEAQKEKEKSCAKKEKEAKHTHPKKRERFTALPSDEEEFKAKIISLLPRHFTVKMKDAFLEYMIYRRKRRKLGDLDSVKRQINKVADWSEAELVQSVDDTIAHAWQGLFLPKISSKYKQDQKISFNHIQQQASRQNHEMLKQLNAFDDLNNLPI
jgi:delta 1-pyrroline-5-carboxylate dehydrogenase